MRLREMLSTCAVPSRSQGNAGYAGPSQLDRNPQKRARLVTHGGCHARGQPKSSIADRTGRDKARGRDKREREPAGRTARSGRRVHAWCYKSSSTCLHTREFRKRKPAESLPGLAACRLREPSISSVARRPRPQQGHDQRSERHPGEYVQPGKRKDQDLQKR